MDNQLEYIWEKALELIKEEVAELSFSTFILAIKPISVKANVINLEVPEEFIKTKVETRFYSLIRNAINQVTRKDFNLHFFLPNEYMEEKEVDLSEIRSKSQLNPRYTFENFVVGKSNRMAHAAAVAISDNPNNSTYNPFFLYGGSGLGKTHLMHAIGNYVLENNSNASVIYVTSEDFTNEFITSLGRNDFSSFRNKYRNVDLLLIDDIQFFGEKQHTKEEFFHTFNALYQSNKQIIIASDRPPNELTIFEERLTTRFQWGLLADIQKPDYETKIAILRRKAHDEGIFIDDEIFEYIAKNIGSNIRELEGALNRIIVYSKMTNSDFNLETAYEALKHLKCNNVNITSKTILDVVSRYFDVKVEDLKSSKRSRNITIPRQVAMYLCRELLDMSYPKIGSEFGSKDHSTVIYACQKIAKEIEDNVEIGSSIEDIKKTITGN